MHKNMDIGKQTKKINKKKRKHGFNTAITQF